MGLRVRRVMPSSIWFDVAFVAVLAALTYALWHGHLLYIDTAVRNWCDAHRPGWFYWLLRAGNLLGAGGFFSLLDLAIALLLVWRRHSVRPVLPVLLAYALTIGVLTALKDWTDRPAPHASIPHPERLGAGGTSYPSGHLTNSFVWFGVLALLLTLWVGQPWRRLTRIAPPVILLITTVYLGYHWLWDTVAGILLGSILWRLIGRVPWDDIPLGRTLTSRGWAGPALERIDRDATPQDRRHRQPA